MQDFIVLGQIPGTNLHFGFITLLILLDIILIIFVLKKYHPKKLKGAKRHLAKVNKLLREFERSIIKKLKPYEKRLIHFRDNVLSPKLKFLK